MDVSSKAGMNLNRLMAVLSQGPLPHRPPPLTQLAIDIAEDDIEKIWCGRDGLANNKAYVHTQPRPHTAGANGSIPVAQWTMAAYGPIEFQDSTHSGRARLALHAADVPKRVKDRFVFQEAEATSRSSNFAKTSTAQSTNTRTLAFRCRLGGYMMWIG